MVRCLGPRLRLSRRYREPSPISLALCCAFVLHSARGSLYGAHMKANGVAMRELRRAKGRGLRRVAADADMSRSYLSELETGRKVAPSADAIVRIAKALDVPVEAITYPETVGGPR